MAERVRKGQTFIIGAVILASMIIMLYSTQIGVITTAESDEPRRFFERTLQEPSQVFEDAVKENRSVRNVKKELYSWNKFVSERARIKGLQYRAIHVFTLPSQGKTVVVNYQDSSQDLNLTVNGVKRNTDVGPYQFLTESFSGDKASVKLSLDGEEFSRSFESYNPRMLTFAEISSDGEIWRNHIIS